MSESRERIETLTVTSVVGENTIIVITFSNARIKGYTARVTDKTEDWKVVDFDAVHRESTSIGAARPVGAVLWRPRPGARAPRVTPPWPEPAPAPGRGRGRRQRSSATARSRAWRGAGAAAALGGRACAGRRTGRRPRTGC